MFVDAAQYRAAARSSNVPALAVACGRDLQGYIVIPSTFTLHPAFPNPFNPATTLCYTLDHPMQVELSVYNLLGQQVRTLTFGLQDAGEHNVPFMAGELASGVYFVRLEAGGRAETQKVVLIR